MHRMIQNVLTEFGTNLTVTSGETVRTIRGFFRAVNSGSWQSMESEATLLGEITRGQYAYIGPADGGIREGDTISLGSKNYLVRRTELYYFRNQPIYQWGLCVEKGVNDIWGSRS